MSSKLNDFYEFGPFRLEPAERLLLRDGAPVSLPPKAFATLVILVERSGRVVGKEELMRAVWPETFVEENNLTQCVFTLRRALSENGNGHSYIETVPKLGYRFLAPVRPSLAAVDDASIRDSREQVAVHHKIDVLEEEIRMVEIPAFDPPPAATQHTAPRQDDARKVGKKRRIYLTTAVLSLAAAALSFQLSLTPALPRVVEYHPISREVEPEATTNLFTDGVHLYYSVPALGGPRLAEMSVTGGDAATVSVVPSGLQFSDLGPSGAEMLAIKSDAGTAEQELWIVPLPAGSPSPVGSLKAHDAAWSPNGEEIVFAFESDLYLAQPDGSAVRLIARLPGPAWQPRWSPDGKWIRFVVRAGSSSLWETAPDGTHLRRLLEDPAETGGWGHWAADSSYFVFPMQHDGRLDLWALPETSGFFGRSGPQPVRLTNGQLDLFSPLPSKDGKRIFAMGVLERVEILRHDAGTNSLVPFLPGVSADSLAFSADGQWVVYSSFPERTLWRSRVDGSERMQLTFAPVQALLPRWSPDGKTIAFTARSPGKAWNIHVIPAQGGVPQPVLESQDHQATPSWSPDGTILAFAGAPWETSFVPRSTAVHCLDVHNQQVETLPDSDGLWSPRWSPDGRYIVAETADSLELKLFDFHTRKWTPLAKTSNAIVEYTTWSRDSAFVYFSASGAKTNGVYRVPVSGNRGVELFLDLRDTRRAETLGQWFTLAPDDSPLLLRDTSIRKIYALELKSP